MDVAALLIDAHSRVRETVHAAVDGLSAEQRGARLDAEANSVAWLVWHLTRVQDDHVADVAGFEQVWTAEAFAGRFGLPLPVEDIGYGHSPDDVAAVRAARQAERTALRAAGLVELRWLERPPGKSRGAVLAAVHPLPHTPHRSPTSRPSARRTTTGSSTSAGTRR